MPQEIFLDAGFWVAIVNERDQWNDAANRLWTHVSENDWQPVTTNWTLYEAMTRLSGSFGRHDLAIEALQRAYAVGAIIIDASTLEEMALDIFTSHSDKRWSVVDCANFACISRRHIRYAVSFDRDFEQAQAEFGFTLLDYIRF